ncbi:MAG: PAS domain S-box protein [Arcticibacter sp.]
MQGSYSEEDEFRRVKGLEAYQILDTEDEIPFNAITELAAELCQMPMAIITLLDSHRQWFKAKIGLSLRETSREFSFCNYTIENDHVLEVNDTLADDRFSTNPFVTGYPNVRFYAGAPLISEDGYRIGALCVMDTSPGQLSDLQRKTLHLLAKEIILHIESAKRNRELKHHLAAAQEYQELFNHSGDIHCILNDTGQIDFVNNSVVDIIGYTADELKGRFIWEFCLPDERSRVLPGLEEAKSRGIDHFKLEIDIITKSGEIKVFAWNTVIRGKRWLINGRDITHQKRNQKLLEQLSLVASHVNNGVIINDAENKAIWVNKAFEAITGYSAADVLGKRIGNLLLRNFTQDETLLYARAQTAEKKSFSVVLHAQRKDSAPVWLSVMNTILLNSEGETEKTIEILTDITQHKEAESRNETLSLALSKSNVGIVVRDNANKVVWFNDAFEDITGYSLEEFRGKHLGDILIGPDTSLNDYRKAKIAFANKEAYEIENLFYTKAGDRVWLYLSNTPLLNNAGELERQVCIVVDITARKKAEQEIIAAREEAIKLGKAKEAFLSVMSHEMRTPLNAIIGISRILLEEDPLDRQLENLNMLKFSTENLLTLINDVLDYTKIETGNLKLEQRPVNLRKIVNSTVESLQFKLDKGLVLMKVDIDESIPEMVIGDKTRIYQILMNLLGNAIKFTEEGEISTSLKVVSQDSDSVTVNFEVSDTGIGISPEKLDYIFETYTQESADTTRKYGGTGLGLAITKKLLQLHQSDIYVKSEKGRGSCFYFTLKFERSKVSVGDDENMVPMATLPSYILIVDDNPINRMVAQKAVMRWGIKSDTADNGREAVEMVKRKDYDLVLMDLHMPVLDGYEATRLIRALPDRKYQKLPIIALTGSELAIRKDLISQSGINDTVMKPFVPVELFKKIRYYLERKD